VKDLLELKLKIKNYCAYQDRCHYDVTNKLYKLGATSYQVDDIIMELMEESFLNEQRYSDNYVKGKLFNNLWGFNKIRQNLKQKRVTSMCIEESISKIDHNDYLDVCRKVIKKRNDSNVYKLKNYLISRGFEYSIIDEVVN